MSSVPRAAAGQLSIWTDVDPAHELDFNRWYDREHMLERMAIPGFRRARRFRCVVSCPRPYLALYDTDSRQTFRSLAYQQAFKQQTEWSQRNFARMRDTQRRVGELTLDVGAAEGGALALFIVNDAAHDGTAPQFQALVARDHVLRASLLRTDVTLSTPLAPGASQAREDGVVMVETNDADTAFDAANALAAFWPAGQCGSVFVFRMMSRFGA
jgi:hypothetical protein